MPLHPGLAPVPCLMPVLLPVQWVLVRRPTCTYRTKQDGGVTKNEPAPLLCQKQSRVSSSLKFGGIEICKSTDASVHNTCSIGDITCCSHSAPFLPQDLFGEFPGSSQHHHRLASTKTEAHSLHSLNFSIQGKPINYVRS